VLLVLAPNVAAPYLQRLATFEAYFHYWTKSTTNERRLHDLIVDAH
jgi:hypothetical protein